MASSVQCAETEKRQVRHQYKRRRQRKEQLESGVDSPDPSKRPSLGILMYNLTCGNVSQRVP